MPNPTSLAADIFNGHIAAVAIAAANELGLFDELDKAGSVHLPSYAGKHQLHGMTLDSIVEGYTPDGEREGVAHAPSALGLE